tara:strand:- start:1544 stop:1900 length:357 start_codon:yes stop_codon:yes gene_type:complete
VAVTYYWSYESLKAEIGPDEYNHEDSVVVINWVYNATDDEPSPHTASMIGSAVVAWDEASPSFVPFANLTASVVDGWVESKLGEEQLVVMRNSLEQNISRQTTPFYKVFNEMPWGDGG